MSDIWTQLSQPIFGLQLWYWLVIITGIIFIIYKWKPKEQKYKAINLIKENKKQINNYFNDYSAKVKFFEKFLLRINYNKIGRIKRITELNIPVKTKTSLKLKKTDDAIIEEIVEGKKPRTYKLKTTTAQFIAFEVFKDNLIGVVKFFTGFGKKYFIVDKTLITRDGNTYVIKQGATFTQFLGVNIFSEVGKDYITDVAFKIMRELELQELVNFTPKMVFMEAQSAKFKMKLDAITKAEKSKYKSRQDRLIDDET